MKKCLFVFALFFLTVVAQAQYPIINSVNLLPNPPVSNLPFKIAVSATLPNSGSLLNRNWVLDAAGKKLMLEYCYSEGLLTVVTTINDTLQLPGTSYSGTLSLVLRAFVSDSLCQIKKSENIYQETITIDNSTGVRTVTDQDETFPFYSNASGKICLRGQAYEFVKLLDLSGRLLREWKDPEERDLIIEAVPEGCYILQFGNAGEVHHLKFIKSQP